MRDSEGWLWDVVDNNEKGDKDERSRGEDTDETHIILQVTSMSKAARTNTKRTRITKSIDSVVYG